MRRSLRYSKRQASTDLLVASVVLGVAGWLSGWNAVATTLIFAGWGAALGGAMLAPTPRRLAFAAGSATLFYYYFGATILLGLGAFHLVTRRLGTGQGERA